MDDQATVSSDGELKKRGDTRPALEDCTLGVLDDYNAIILPNSVQLVESELPLSEADNCDELSGVFLFRQIFSSYDNTLQCLFCRNKYSLSFPADLEEHYQVVHELAVNTSEAVFNENIVFVCVPSDVNEKTVLNSGCRVCDTTLKTLVEVRGHYPNAHNKTVRLVPESDVTEIGNFFYCGLCGHPSVDFPSHHQHMKVTHRMQTYACRYCTYCTSRPSRLRTHVIQRHLQDQWILSCCENMDDLAIVSSDEVTKNSRLMKTGHLYQQDNNITSIYTSIFHARHKLVLELAQKRKAQSESKLQSPKISKASSNLTDSGINYDDPLSPMLIASNRAERISREKQKNQPSALKKRGDTRPALEDCTLGALDDYNAMILPNSVQLVESELPLSEADNCDELSGVFLFRQIFSSYDSILQCLFCRNKYPVRFPADLEEHYQVVHELAVNTSEAVFNENIVFVCVPSDVNEETVFNSGCRFCDATLKTLAEVRDHYPNAHNKTVRLVPESDVTEIGNFFYCGLCGHPSVDFSSHHQHMKVMHRMQTYVCRHCTYFTSSPSRLRTHVKERHLQDHLDLICNAL